MSVGPLKRAIRIVGGQAALGRACGVSQAHVWNWLHRERRVPAGRVLAVEIATGGRVRRDELRPDLYPPEDPERAVLLEAARTATGELYPSVGTNVEDEWRQLRTRRVRDPAYEPARTPLGAELRRLRAKILQSGQPLLDWDDIERLTAELRGERS